MLACYIQSLVIATIGIRSVYNYFTVTKLLLVAQSPHSSSLSCMSLKLPRLLLWKNNIEVLMAWIRQTLILETTYPNNFQILVLFDISFNAWYFLHTWVSTLIRTRTRTITLPPPPPPPTQPRESIGGWNVPCTFWIIFFIPNKPACRKKQTNKWSFESSFYRTFQG